MSLRRRRPLAEPVALAARQLKKSEANIALLDRVRPLNWQAERQRLIAAAQQQQRPQPSFEYAPAPELGEARRLVDAICAASGSDVELTLLVERAVEIGLEAQLAESVGRAAFRDLAGKRFPLPAEHQQRRAEAAEWAKLGAAGDPPARLHISDDRHDPASLWSLLTKRLDEKRLAVRVEVVPGLVSLAAVADGVVRIRAGARLAIDVAARIALHEVDGHVLPRVAGERLGGVLLAGSARGSEQEEGRAILLEERARLLGLARRAEIGLRYLAAESVRGAADFWQTCDVLLEHGASVEMAVELSSRVHRGGGLGRELLYLSGYAQVASSLQSSPQLEAALECGRISTDAAARLLAAGSVELDHDGDVI